MAAHCMHTAPPSLRKSSALHLPSQLLSQQAKGCASLVASRSSKQKHVTTTYAAATETAEAVRPADLKSSSPKPTAQQSTVVITGASSGLGLAATKALVSTGQWHVVMACRDFSKAEKAARRAGFPKESYTIMHCDLASLTSVRQFVDNLRAAGRSLDVVVCNAAVYLPTDKEPTYTADELELSFVSNHLGHFLLANLLLEDLKKRRSQTASSNGGSSPRMIIVGSITGNNNTVAGNVPPMADLGQLEGLEARVQAGHSESPMIDGKKWDGAKAYKDSKVCNMLTMGELHRRFHDDTGVVFASLYPGCIAETGLFRNHYKLFRTIFPPFQKYITKGYVSEEESGRRLAQVVSDPSFNKSGRYWSWRNETGSFENNLSDEASDIKKAGKLWDLSAKLVEMQH